MVTTGTTKTMMLRVEGDREEGEGGRTTTTRCRQGGRKGGRGGLARPLWSLPLLLLHSRQSRDSSSFLMASLTTFPRAFCHQTSFRWG